MKKIFLLIAGAFALNACTTSNSESFTGNEQQTQELSDARAEITKLTEQLAKYTKEEERQKNETFQKLQQLDLITLGVDPKSVNVEKINQRAGSTGIMYLKGHLTNVYNLGQTEVSVVQSILAKPTLLKLVYTTNKKPFMQMVGELGRKADVVATTEYLLEAMTTKPFQKEFAEYKKSAGNYDINFNDGEQQNGPWQKLIEQTQGTDVYKLQQQYLAYLFAQRRNSDGGAELTKAWIEILKDIQKQVTS